MLRKGLLPGVLVLLLLAPHQSALGQAKSFDREVAGLVANPAVAEALKTIETLEPRTEADLITLTEIPAPPFMEEARGRAFAELLRAAGADSVVVDEVGNVLAYRAGTVGGKTVALGGTWTRSFRRERM